jgi:23S rRNA (cytidine1920-2'-O)/16S rRNA (cytidine1409-2'-O)-methyltransferase
MGTERTRIDQLLAERGLFSSRTAARAAVMAGLVTVNGKKVDKPGTAVAKDAAVDVRELPRYVSRGGLKLEKALAAFSLQPAGRIAMDVGASTGGFTDCMLQNGATRVYSVDVGYGQLDWRLRQDPRVVSMERTNIRYLTPEDLPQQPDFATVDVSFISLALVLPVLKKLGVGEVLALVKPQFEVGKGRVGKKGVVRDKSDHIDVLNKVADAAASAGYHLQGVTYSPVRGPEGNIEYLFHLGSAPPGDDTTLDFTAVVNAAHNELSEKGNAPAIDE